MLQQLGRISLQRGRYDEAHVRFQQALDLHLALNSRRAEGVDVSSLGQVALALGRLDEAERLFGQSLAIRRETGDRRGEAVDLTLLGQFHRVREQFGAAESRLREGLALWKNVGDRRGTAWALAESGMLALDRGQLRRARSHLNRALSLHQRVEDAPAIAGDLTGLGAIARDRRRLREAETLLSRALALAREAEDRPKEARVLRESAALMQRGRQRSRQLDRAERLFRESLAMAQNVGAPLDIADAQFDLGRYLVQRRDHRGNPNEGYELLTKATRAYAALGLPRESDESKRSMHWRLCAHEAHNAGWLRGARPRRDMSIYMSIDMSWRRAIKAADWGSDELRADTSRDANKEARVIQHLSGDITWFQFESLIALSDLITHGVFARHGGVSLPPYATLNAGPATKDDLAAKMENYARIASALPSHPILVGTTPLQGSEIIEVTPAVLGERQKPAVLLPGGCDAFVTRMRGVGVFWAVADCTVVMLVDPEHQAIGLVHAGWRGTRDAIVLKTVQRMEEAYGTRAADLQVAIAPTIGPCCYEVDERVRTEFANNAFADGHACFSAVLVQDEAGIARPSLRLDLAESNKSQVLAAGVPEDHIEMSALCTGTRRDLFFSHRMEGGNTGRFAVVLGLL